MIVRCKFEEYQRALLWIINDEHFGHIRILGAVTSQSKPPKIRTSIRRGWEVLFCDDRDVMVFMLQFGGDIVDNSIHYAA